MIKQTIKDIVLWGATLGCVMAAAAYIALDTIDNDLERRANTYESGVEFREVNEYVEEIPVIYNYGEQKTAPLSSGVYN